MSNSKKNTRYQPLGSITSISKTSFGCEGQIESSFFKVSAYTSKTIRVSISQYEDFDEVSYAVVSSPADLNISRSEDQDCYALITDALRLEINQNKFGITLKTTDGRVIVEDEPGLGCGWMGKEASVYKTLQQGERFVGLGEKTGNLDRRGTGWTNWNTDAFGYATDGDPIYASIPFYIGIHSGLIYGVFLDNSYKSHFNFGASNNRFSSFTVEGGDINYYLIHGESIAEILTEYAKLTGHMPLPPMWSLGYQQCRYSYYPDKEVIRLAETFREKQIPADVLYLDIHYMDEYKVFTWDKSRFPDPEGMKKKLEELGFKLVVITDPGIKTQNGYEAFDAFKKEELFLKYPDGSDYEGEVWPGWCSFPDFTQAEARALWSKYVAKLTDQGVDGVWNDMNEIATWGQKLPDVIDFHYEGEEASSKRGRNVYGMQMARAAFEGLKLADENKRPFVLTRAGFAGIQRYSTLWTGDNVSYDDHMLVGVRLINSLGLSGVPYAGYDVGGFVGEPSAALFARWIAIGAFSPFFRGHTMINTRDAEPWSFGEEVEEIARNFISLRYRLLPYIYTMFYEASMTGMPISRSLAISYPHDANIYDELYQNQYLFGDAFLVAPVKSTEEIIKVYLPEGSWYDLYTDKPYEGGQVHYLDVPLYKIPVFVKSGSMVPVQGLIQSTQDRTSDVLELHIYASNEDIVSVYYEDAGDGYANESGEHLSIEIQYNMEANQLDIYRTAGNAMYESKFKDLKLIMHGFDVDQIRFDGQHHTLDIEQYAFITPMSNFDPFIKPPQEDVMEVRSVLVPFMPLLRK